MPLYFCVHVHTSLRLHTIITILRMSIEDVCDPTTLNFFFYNIIKCLFQLCIVYKYY